MMVKTKLRPKEPASAARSAIKRVGPRDYHIARLKHKTAERNYAKEADLTKEQFEAFIYLIATSANYDKADGLIKKFYPNYSAKEKYDLLSKHFNFRIVSGTGAKENKSVDYNFAIQFILEEARDFGPESIIKKQG